MKKTPRSPNYTDADAPYSIINGCVVQKLPKWDAENLEPYKWEVVAPLGYRISGYMTTSIRRCTKKEALEFARHRIEEGEPG